MKQQASIILMSFLLSAGLAMADDNTKLKREKGLSREDGERYLKAKELCLAKDALLRGEKLSKCITKLLKETKQ